MSARSQQRKREMAVIDAAVELVAHQLKFNYRLSLIDQRLHTAVDEYVKHGLVEASRVKVGRYHPDTSQEAAEMAKRFALTDSGAVFRKIYFTWRRNRAFAANKEWGDPKEGLTCDEVEAEMERSHQTISPRINELRDTGWIVDSGERRKTRQGGNAIVWTPSEAAKAHVDVHGLPIVVETQRGEG